MRTIGAFPRIRGGSARAGSPAKRSSWQQGDEPYPRGATRKPRIGAGSSGVRFPLVHSLGPQWNNSITGRERGPA